tara:strand:+ start:137 stop:1462 length:1326 start_codon:yes stop_codon:yes gene_type:complete
MPKHFKSPGDKISKTFCALPWAHMHVWPEGKTYTCCLADNDHVLGNVEDMTLEEMWNVPLQKSIRKDMLEGKEPATCRKCYSQERNNIKSMRTAANIMLEKHIDRFIETTQPDGHSDEFKLLYWDFRFSNICNFKCRMCGGSLSSKWFEDEKNIFGTTSLPKALIHVNDISKKNIYEYLDEFIEEVEEVYFAGGEPLLMDEHYMILERLIKVGNTKCRIRYNTNFSFIKYKKWDLFELWRNFTEHDPHNVQIFASIDTFGKYAEYSRKGTNWAKIESNIKKTLEAGFEFSLSATTTIFTILHLTEHVDYMMNKVGVKPYHLHLNNVLTFPSYYHINILPDEIKEKISNKMDKHLEGMSEKVRKHFDYKYDSIKKYLFSKPDKDIEQIRSKFKLLTDKLDKGRDESFVEIYPELADWYNSLSPHGDINTVWDNTSDDTTNNS